MRIFVKSSFAIFLFFLSTYSFAQSSEETTLSVNEVTVETPAVEEEITRPAPFNDYSRGFISRFGLFLGAAPVPIVSGGMGVSGEMLITPWLSATGGYERRRTSTEDSLDVAFFDEESRVMAKNTALGLRLYNGLSQRWWRGFYLSSGYKWSKLDTKYTPTFNLFGGPPASRIDSDEGIYAGLGYRFSALIRKNTTFILDVGLNYEPGAIKITGYEHSFSLSSVGVKDEQARVFANVKYEWFPEAKIGLRF